jgi:hypothetical protein
VAKFGERLAEWMNKDHTNFIYRPYRFKIINLNKVKGKVKYHVEVLNRFAALEDLEINSACERFKDNIKISTRETL